MKRQQQKRQRKEVTKFCTLQGVLIRVHARTRRLDCAVCCRTSSHPHTRCTIGYGSVWVWTWKAVTFYKAWRIAGARTQCSILRELAMPTGINSSLPNILVYWHVCPYPSPPHACRLPPPLLPALGRKLFSLQLVWHRWHHLLWVLFGWYCNDSDDLKSLCSFLQCLIPPQLMVRAELYNTPKDSLWTISRGRRDWSTLVFPSVSACGLVLMVACA